MNQHDFSEAVNATTQERIKEKLSASGIPAKEIKVQGSTITIWAWGREAAEKWASLLHQFCRSVRGPVESHGYTDPEHNVNIPKTHRIFLIGGTI